MATTDPPNVGRTTSPQSLLSITLVHDLESMSQTNKNPDASNHCWLHVTRRERVTWKEKERVRESKKERKREIRRQRLRTNGFSCNVVLTETSDVPFSNAIEFSSFFQNAWSASTHPNDYPTGSAQWSPMVLTSHSTGYRMWGACVLASAGVQSVAEVRACDSWTRVFYHLQDHSIKPTLMSFSFSSRPGRQIHCLWT
jgi:hypothetical protein